jgi:hypothetical protein
MNSAPDTKLYDRDFYEWIQQNVDLLRRGCVEQADLVHIAEEIEDLGKRDRRAITSRLEVLVMHLLKWRYQPEKRDTPSGRSSGLSKIMEQRRRVERILKDSPSLKPFAACALAESYLHAATRASLETGIPLNQFPAESPFTLVQVLDDEFLPN